MPPPQKLSLQEVRAPLHALAALAALPRLVCVELDVAPLAGLSAGRSTPPPDAAVPGAAVGILALLAPMHDRPDFFVLTCVEERHSDPEPSHAQRFVRRLCAAVCAMLRAEGMREDMIWFADPDGNHIRVEGGSDDEGDDDGE